jgi:calpain-7
MTVELGQGPYKEILATSEDGAHSDAASGVRVEDFDLLPSRLFLAISRIRVKRETRREASIRSLPGDKTPTSDMGQGPYKEILATSEDGAHSDAASGVRVEDFDLLPSVSFIFNHPLSNLHSFLCQCFHFKMILHLPSRTPNVEDHFEVEALAEERVEIGKWVIEDE